MCGVSRRGRLDGLVVLSLEQTSWVIVAQGKGREPLSEATAGVDFKHQGRWEGQ